MSKKFLSRLALIITIVCMICMTSCVVVFAEGETVGKAVAEEPVTDVKIMHITDVHYIPAYYCYTGPLKENDFATKIKGDPKLMLESYAILERTCEMIMEADVDYVLLTGDITSNGEKQSLIDVANAMRALQNEKRKTNPYFQVLVVPGNHDVFNNRHASFYATEDGKKIPAGIASREEFIKIFASLGYPDMSIEEAKAFYTSEELTIDPAKHLPYKTEGDTTFIPNKIPRPDIRYDYYAEETLADDTDKLGGLTYIAYDDHFNVSICGFDTTLSVKNDQRTEGEFTKENIEWYVNKDLTGYSQIIMGHHNIIKHHPKHEQYTPQFVSYGWEEVAEKLTAKGARYCFTGHFHANDVHPYVSYNNNILYDIETGATISQGAAIRKVDILRYADGAEDLKSVLIPVDKADFSYLLENNLIPEGYEDCFEGNMVDVQKYIAKKLFNPYLQNMIDSFIGPTKINKMLDDKLKTIDLDLKIVKIKLDLKEIVGYLLSEVNTNVLKDYTYSGDMDSLKLEENKYIGYLHELLSGAIKMPVSSDGHTFEDLVIYSYGAHLMGDEAANVEALPDWVKEAIKGFTSGDKMQELLDILLYSDNGLMRLVDGLIKTPLDFSQCPTSYKSISRVLGLVDNTLDPTALVLDTTVPKLLGSSLVKSLLDSKGINFTLPCDTVMESVNSLIDTYVTRGNLAAIGNVLCNIAISFGTDDYDSTAFGEVRTYKLHTSDEHSYSGHDCDANIEPTVDNGRLPSMITVTMGEDAKSSRNFVWFTSQFVTDGFLKYREVGSDKWQVVETVGEIYPYSYPIMDFGIFSTKIDKNIARHNVTLAGLSAGTKYEYVIGNKFTDGEINGTFKTAGDSGAFEVQIISDIQGMGDIAYDMTASKLMRAKQTLGESDFIVNLGDMVSDAKNSDQWGYAINSLAEYQKDSTQVIARGGKENKLYVSGKTNIRKKGVNVEVKDITYNPLDLHYDIQGETYYSSFDYNGVHFVVLDTCDVDNSGKLNDGQITWLESDLSAYQDKHVVVLMHKGIYDAGIYSQKAEIVELRKQLSPIFYNNKVDMVFSGYEQRYSESKLLGANGEVVDDGVLYVSVGTMGDNVYDYVANDNNMAFGSELPACQTFGRLVYDGTNLSYQGYTFDESGAVTVQDAVNNANGNNQDTGVVTPNAENKGNNLTWLWITLGVVLGLAVVGVIVFLVIKKGKKAKTSENKSQDTDKSDTDGQ